MDTNTAELAAASVSDQEVKLRIAEYRREGLERRAMRHVIFHFPHILCPWPGCSYSIFGIDFQLEKLADPQEYSRLVPAWWNGPGLVGRCPGCKQFVLYGMTEKSCVTSPDAQTAPVLPDDWHQRAFVVS